MTAGESVNKGSGNAPKSLLSVAARRVGRAAGRAAKALGLEHAALAPHAQRRAAPAKRISTHARRKQEAEELKSKAKELFSKSSTDLGVPYRRVIGQSAANWSDKDLAYVRQLIERQSAETAAPTAVN